MSMSVASCCDLSCCVVDRASKLLNELKNEEFEKLKAGRSFPEIRAGDSVEIAKLPYISSKDADTIKGVVIGVTNRASETAIKLLNVREKSYHKNSAHEFFSLIG
jgi:ribosomal protein L19